MKEKNINAEKRKKDVVKGVEKAIIKYKQSETISELGVEAKRISEKLDGVTVADAKIYLFAKHQREVRKEKFVRARDMLLKLWAKLQIFAERYEQTQQQQTTKPTATKKGEQAQNKEKDEVMERASSIMKRWAE